MGAFFCESSAKTQVADMAKLVAIVFMALMVSAYSRILIDTDEDGYGSMYSDENNTTVTTPATTSTTTTTTTSGANGLTIMSAIFLTFFALISKKIVLNF